MLQSEENASLTEVQQLISHLNNPLLDNDTAQKVQHRLYTLGKSNEAWNWSSLLLNSSKEEWQWYGANLLATKIARGDTIVLEGLTGNVLRLFKSMPVKVVKTKLAVALVASLARFGWNDEVKGDDVVLALHGLIGLEDVMEEGEWVMRLAGLSEADVKAVLEFCIVVPQEVKRMEFGDARKEATFRGGLQKAGGYVTSLVKALMENNVLVSEAIECLSQWAESGELKRGVEFVPLLLQRFPLTEAIDCMTALLEHSNDVQGKQVALGLSEWLIRFWLEMVKRGEDELRPLVTLMIHLVLRHAGILVDILNQVMPIFQALIQIMQWPGTFPEDEEISGMVVESNVWNEVAETWVEEEKGNLGVDLFVLVAEGIVTKMSIPNGWKTWSMEDKEKFWLYRRDACEVLEACSMILGERVCQVLSNLAVNGGKWQQREVGLYALTQLLDKSFGRGLEDGGWRDLILGMDVGKENEKVKNAYLDVVRELGLYVAKEKRWSGKVMELVMKSLQHPTTSGHAALAFAKLAECKGLEMSVDMVVELWNGVGKFVVIHDRPRLYKGLGKVMSGMIDGWKAIERCLEGVRGVEEATWMMEGMSRDDSSNESHVEWDEKLKGSVDLVMNRWFKDWPKDGELEDRLDLALALCKTRVFPLVKQRGLELAHWLVNGYQLNVTVAKYLQVVAVLLNKMDDVWSREVLQVIARLVVNMQQNTMEEYPDVVYAFFNDVLSEVLLGKPRILASLDVDLARGLFCQMIPLGLRVQERLAFNSVVGFVGLLLQQDTVLEGLVKGVMGEVGVVLIGELLIGISGRSPKSLVVNLGELLYRICSKFPEIGRSGLDVGFEMVKGIKGEKAGDKGEMIKALMSNSRNMKRFKEVVNGWSQRWRGWE